MSYTQCPGCLTLFRIDVGHLRQAGGVVRCGLCGESFNALASLCDRLPEDLPPPNGSVPDAGPGSREAVASGETSESTATPAPLPADPAAAPPKHQPPPIPDWGDTTRLEVETPSPSPPPRRWRWLVWTLLLLLLAGGGGGVWLWPERERLLQDPDWRPWLAEACDLVGCELPLPERPQAVAVLERELAAVPAGGGTLRFTATVVNRAPQPIAWPELVVHLLDAAGRTVAEHRVPAAGYLVGSPPSGGMPAGERVRLDLELPDPGPGAASFEIRFR